MKLWIRTTTPNGNALLYEGGEIGHDAGFTRLFN